MIGGKKVLIVEDEIVVAKDIQDTLKGLGYSVFEPVSTGEEAVLKSEESQPDLVLMDIKLGGNIDGIEAAEKIFNRFNIPVIYLTAYGDKNTLARAKITEPYGYILKPYNERELHSNIEMALYKHDIERKFRDNERWLSTLLQSIGDAVIATDVDKNISYMNPVAEVLTGWGKKEALGKSLNKIFNIVSEKNNKPEESLVEAAINQNTVVYLDKRNIVLIDKEGKERPIDDSAAPIKDMNGNTTGCIIVFRDISRQKQMTLELENHKHNLEKLVEERTSELTQANKQLQREISIRRRAEEDSNKTKDNLQNIIDSASEVIISVDENNKINLWNKTAELLTNYKKKEVVGKCISKLPVFSMPDLLQDTLNGIINGKKPKLDELILITKNADKKIIKVSYSVVKTNEEHNEGVLFVGTDITQDLESHGKLLKGSSYLISDEANKSALNLFLTFVKSDYNCLLITRSTPEIIECTTLLKKCNVLLLSQQQLGKYDHIIDIDSLITNIKEFTLKNKDSVVLLDGVHYLLTRFSFEEFTDALFNLRETISGTKSILLLRVDPSLLSQSQMAVIKNELLVLPSQKIDDIEIQDELHDMLTFINNHNKDNSIVSFKKISKEFGIVSKTTAKRIKMLEKKGLILIKKQGRLKTLHVSQKGKTLLARRQAI